MEGHDIECTLSQLVQRTINSNCDSRGPNYCGLYYYDEKARKAIDELTGRLDYYKGGIGWYNECNLDISTSINGELLIVMSTTHWNQTFIYKHTIIRSLLGTMTHEEIKDILKVMYSSIKKAMQDYEEETLRNYIIKGELS